MTRSTIEAAAFLLCALLPFPAHSQTNHKPVLLFRTPVAVNYVVTRPLTLAVSAVDPDGDTLTFTWKVNQSVKKSGPDTSFIFSPSDVLERQATFVICVFSDPGGLSDSTYWHIGPDMNVDNDVTLNDFSLSQNYPNPFNPSTEIVYEIPEASIVTLKIFNALGQLVATLEDVHKEAGHYQVQWNANVPSGIYFYRLQAGEFLETKKMILLR